MPCDCTTQLLVMKKKKRVLLFLHEEINALTLGSEGADGDQSVQSLR